MDLSIKYNNEVENIEYENANNLLNKIIDYTTENEKKIIEKDIKFIYEAIGESWLITNRYESGKPESGSEHIFAKTLEKEIDIPHACSVSNGIILMILSHRYSINSEIDDSDKKIIAILKNLDLFDLNMKYNITYNLIEKVYLSLILRKDRYSIIDLIYKDGEIKAKVLNKYKVIMDKHLK